MNIIRPTSMEELIKTDYTSLMEKKIQKILFVCSNYDAFMMREDGQIETRLKAEYDDLNITLPPRFTWVNNSEDAFNILSDSSFDLIISMYNSKDPYFFETTRKIKQKETDTPIVLLANYSKKVFEYFKSEDMSAIDYVFSWNGNVDLILAIIKLLEDRMNAENDILNGGVRAILLVEDSIRYYSTYLPAMYKLVLKQSSEFLDEAMNEHELKMRKRARPKIFLANNLEDAKEIFDKYKNYFIGIISDIAFVVNKNDAPESEKSDAGIELAQYIRSQVPQMPIILQSSQESMKQVAKDMGLGFIQKYSETLLHQLSKYMRESFSFGDMVLRDEESGRVIRKISNLRELQEALENVSDKVLNEIISHRRLSKWMYSRGLFQLANSLRDKVNEDFKDINEVRLYIISHIKDYRLLAAQGIIANFDSENYSRYIWFSKLGDGSLGGKARGLAFINNLLLKYRLTKHYKGVELYIPRTITIASDYFDTFIIENGLDYVIESAASDDEILSEFVSSRLPDALIEQLKAYISTVYFPLAIRSSSILEDSLYQPFAGIYSTYMIPYTQNKEQMLRLLEKAIKSVYASVYYAASRAYIQTTANMISEEKMAVVIQGICGSEDNGYYFPTFSGVARSLNHYPLGDEKPQEGIVNLAFGLGKAVVDGEKTLRFSPRHPQKSLQLSTPRITLVDTQNSMFALDLKPEEFKTSINDGVNIHKFTIPETEGFRNLAHVASSWDMNDSKLVPNTFSKGPRVITFSRILEYNTLPIAQIITDLLEICRYELGTEVEIEFAVNMDVPKDRDAIFNVLQVRPISEYHNSEDYKITDKDKESALIYSEKALGFGFIEGITDLIYVKEDAFDKSKTREMAAEIGEINAKFKEQGRNYILVGPGRWGSSDPWLGIPISWNQISQAKVIVETGMPDFNIDPSQGTHFFQNITSLGVGYINIMPFKGDGTFKKELLPLGSNLPSANSSLEYDSEFISTFHFSHEPKVYMDGKSGKGIILLSD